MKKYERTKKIRIGYSKYMYIDGGRLYINEDYKDVFEGNDIVVTVNLGTSYNQELCDSSDTTFQSILFQLKNGRIYQETGESTIGQTYKMLRKLNYHEVEQLLNELNLAKLLKQFFDPEKVVEEAYIVNKMTADEYVKSLKVEYLNRSVGLTSLDNIICMNLRARSILKEDLGSIFNENKSYCYQWSERESIKVFFELIDGEFSDDIYVEIVDIQLIIV